MLIHDYHNFCVFIDSIENSNNKHVLAFLFWNDSSCTMFYEIKCFVTFLATTLIKKPVKVKNKNKK